MPAKKDTTTEKGDRVILFHGADDAMKRAAVDKLTSQLTDPDYRDFDQEELYGSDVTANRLLTAASVPPIASKRRLLIVFQPNEIPLGEQQSLATKLDRIPASACIVMICPAPEMQDGRPKKGSEVEKELLAAVKKIGKVQDFPLLKDQAAIPALQEMVRAEGKSISSTAAASVIRRSGTDTGVLRTEVAKLVSYTGDRKTIVDDDVEAVTTETVEEKIFAMMDAIGLQRSSEALGLLRPLLYGGGGRVEGPALRTLTMLARHFRQLWQARIMIDAGCRVAMPGAVPPAVEAALPEDASILKEKDWKVRKLMEQARNFTIDQLADAFNKIAAVDMSIKGIEGAVSDSGLAMELLIIQISSRTNAKKGR